MQITPNPPAESENADANVPLEDGQEQLVIELDLRRAQDEGYGDGHGNTPIASLQDLLGRVNPLRLDDLSYHLDSLAEIFVFDCESSRIGIQGSLTVSFDEFRELISNFGSATTEDDEEPETEVTGTDEQETNTEPENVVDEPAVIEPTPETLEDIPHDAEPETEVTSEDPAPVGDSVTSEPGPVDPPVETETFDPEGGSFDDFVKSD